MWAANNVSSTATSPVAVQEKQKETNTAKLKMSKMPNHNIVANYLFLYIY